MPQIHEGTESPLPAEGRGNVRRKALVRILVLGGILLLATQMRVVGDEATLLGQAGPSCLIGQHFGDAACPTCGLTRSVSLAVQGDLGSAVSYHGAGPWIALILALGLLVEANVFLKSERHVFHRTLARLGRWVLLFGVALGWIGKALG